MQRLKDLPKQIANNVSRETLHKFEIYEKLLLKWQKSLNLVSRGTLEDFWSRHIADSLQILPYLSGKKILDIGSGAGFPGAVIAMAGQFEVTCVDSDSRKMIFLSELARNTDTKINICTERIENLNVECYDSFCSRGFASIKNLIKIMHKKSSGMHGVFLKGAKIHEEIDQALQAFNFMYEIIPSITDTRGRIIIIDTIEAISADDCGQDTKSHMINTQQRLGARFISQRSKTTIYKPSIKKDTP